MWKVERGIIMEEYTRKDEIFFGDDPRAKKAIGKKVYGGNNPTRLLSLANNGAPDLWCETLAIVREDGEKRPFTTYVESPWYNTGYKHYDIIIVKKDDDVGTDD